MQCTHCLRMSNTKQAAPKTETPKVQLPAHLVAALAKYEAKQKAFGFTMTDVTPKGFGPSEK